MIISVKSNSSGGSSRGLVHYLAHSKFDRAKEEVDNRSFFNETDNDLDVRTANRNLSRTGTKPTPGELLHLIIAPSQEELEKIGGDLTEQKESLKIITREVVAQLEKENAAKKLKWVAVTHFNTAHPHAHLAIQKEYFNGKGQREILRITKEMLHYNQIDQNGEKKLTAGSLILAAAKTVAEISAGKEKSADKLIGQEGVSRPGKSPEHGGNKLPAPAPPVPNPNNQERRILAEEMFAAAEIKSRRQNIENLLEHGDKKRFRIKNEATGQTQYLSVFDLERKIEFVSRQKARKLHPKNSPKQSLAVELFREEERNLHQPLFNQLDAIRRHVLGFENRHLIEAEEKHQRLRNQTLLIEKKYERTGSSPPLPIFTPDEIQQLQTSAVKDQDTAEFLKLENIRRSNALELNRPNRREEDLRELLAAKLVVEVKLEAAEERMRGSSVTKDLTKLTTGDSFAPESSTELSPEQIDSKNHWWQNLKTATFRLIFPSAENKTRAENNAHPIQKIHFRKEPETLAEKEPGEIQKLREFGKTLEQVLAEEIHPEKNFLQPSFSPAQLAEIEDLCLQQGLTGIAQKSLCWQEQWLLEQVQPGSVHPSPQSTAGGLGKSADFPSENAKKIIGNFIAGRSLARIVLAEVKIAKTEQNMIRHQQQKIFSKLRISDPQTGKLLEVSLHDLAPRRHYYLLDSLLAGALEKKELKEKREAVQEAVLAEEKELKRELQLAKNNFTRLENQKNEFRESFVQEADPLPLFTPKEIAILNEWKNQTGKAGEADRIQSMIAQAEKSKRVGRLQDHLNLTARELIKSASEIIQIPEKFASSKVENSEVQQLEPVSRRPDFTSEPSANPLIQPRSGSEKIPVKEKGPER